MEKIKLKNQAEIQIEGGMTNNYFEVIVLGYDSMKTLYDQLTDDNLSRFEVLNSANMVCCVLENKRISNERHFEVIQGTDNLKVKIHLEDVDKMALRLKEVQANIEYLLMVQDMA